MKIQAYTLCAVQPVRSGTRQMPIQLLSTLGHPRPWFKRILFWTQKTAG
jgi:hypothetical protein